MDKTQWIKSLCYEKSVQCLEHMPSELFNKAQLKKIPSGAYVVEKGETISSVILCFDGKMQVKNEFKNGVVYSFALIEPIAYIGAMELLADSSVYSAFLQTKTECVILKIPRSDFLEWLYSDRWLMLEVLKFVSKSMFEQSWNSGDCLIYPSSYLVSRYLVESCKECDQESILIQKSKEEISSLFGVSVRTVQRVLKQFKEEGLIHIDRNGILINSDQYNKLSKKVKEMRANL